MDINGIGTGIFWAILAGLFVFGLAYNQFVAWLEETGRDRGYTAILVVIGTLITVLATVPLIGMDAVTIVLAAFAASGVSMAAGSWERYSRQRGHDEREAQRLARELLEDGDR